MTPHLVADVGNTRIKWGLVAPDGGAIARVASLPEDEADWQAQADEWRLGGPLSAMQAGIFLSVAGCIRCAVRIYAGRVSVKKPPHVFFTGGQAKVLLEGMAADEGDESRRWEWWPEQTLIGILDSVKGVP